MKKLLLMKTQRNQVLEELKAQGLSVSEFEWSEVQKNRIPMVADAYSGESYHPFRGKVST